MRTMYLIFTYLLKYRELRDRCKYNLINLMSLYIRRLIEKLLYRMNNCDGAGVDNIILICI